MQKGQKMKIGVISDTHAGTLDDLPKPILTTLAGVDLIVHAGDFTERAVLEGLKTLGEVRAVRGNMDSAEIKALLPEQDLFTVHGKRVGLVHGSGGPWGIADRIREMFSDVDLIIYGHSHEAANRIIQKSLLFNPGRARDSFGLLTIDEEIKGEIVRI
jgi:putative phosphoesterase